MNIESQEVFDTGKELISISRESGRKGPIFTAYIDGCSIRCGVMHIPRMREGFIRGIGAICSGASKSILAKIEAYIVAAL